MENKYAIVNEETANYIEEGGEILLFDTEKSAEMHAIDISVKKPYVVNMTEQVADVLPGR